jgi:hypothetical protein
MLSRNNHQTKKKNLVSRMFEHHLGVSCVQHNIVWFLFQVHSHKHMKRTESRKSHSWWWDSYVSPKNSKWLAENIDGELCIVVALAFLV